MGRIFKYAEHTHFMNIFAAQLCLQDLRIQAFRFAFLLSCSPVFFLAAFFPFSQSLTIWLNWSEGRPRQKCSDSLSLSLIYDGDISKWGIIMSCTNQESRHHCHWSRSWKNRAWGENMTLCASESFRHFVCLLAVVLIYNPSRSLSALSSLLGSL